MDRFYRRSWRPRMLLAAGAAVALTAAGCGGGDSAGGGAGAGLPDTIKVIAISETTGFAGPAGKASENGQRVALEEINSSKFLGESKLEIDFKDTGSQPAQGVALLNQAIQSKASVVLGSILSTVVAAEAPLAERSRVPMIYLSSSGEFAQGTKYVWAATPPADQYFHWETEYLRDKNAKNVAIIYNSDVSSTQKWADSVWPPLAQQAGLTIVAKEASPTSATDASGVVSKVVAKNPDAVVVLASGTANNAIVLALRRANYGGIIAGSIGMAGAINPLKDQGYGVFWPTNFSNLVQAPEAKNFVDRYQKMFNALPNNYAAAAYDEVWFLARALKQADSTDREAINTALGEVGSAGFDGALGKITYKDNVSQAPGLLIEWRDDKEVPVEGYGG
ncbi:ABC transporter substrate-binding protein [Phytohabitans sp. ZYX-F-186]|uniref:ABC transporter substrate-binding protein n=1 Tax=Phytohabitans maris TaxID=3071409 RepID=A0ABU0ZBS9_9ACTN|nr:ABC transporter substrate-binding protein [Phytohabitans sp. ZYX-F-186]MDQ7903785.1 ABC transporter substrate-binding protein [Phytohabitans sp. ZYX-F-186]